MTGGLHNAFVDELRDAYDAEKQLLKALPKLAKAASSTQLRTAFLDHLEETRGHVERLEQVFASIDERVRGKHCDGIAGIIDEGNAVMEEGFDPATLDACLIAAGQRSEHYEMAAYGTLAAWAKTMGHTEAAQLLDSILQEEKAADEKLNQLAEGGINRQALSEVSEDDEQEEGTGFGAAIKRVVFGDGARGRNAKSRTTRKAAAPTGATRKTTARTARKTEARKARKTGTRTAAGRKSGRKTAARKR